MSRRRHARSRRAPRDVNEREIRGEEIRTDSPSGECRGGYRPSPASGRHGLRRTHDHRRGEGHPGDHEGRRREAREAQAGEGCADCPQPPPRPTPSRGGSTRPPRATAPSAPSSATPAMSAERWADPGDGPRRPRTRGGPAARVSSPCRDGRYGDGRALRGRLQRKADEIARAPKAAAHDPSVNGHAYVAPPPPQRAFVLKVVPLPPGSDAALLGA